MFDLSRKALRDRFRTLYGAVEKSAKGDDRLNTFINNALAQLWSDIPDRYKMTEFCFRFEPSQSWGYLDCDPQDPRTMLINMGVTSSADFIAMASAGTLAGRWIEIQEASTDGSGKWIQRRIRSAEATLGPIEYRIVLDEPWVNTTDSGLSYRIYTREYPLPATISKLKSVTYDDGVSNAYSPIRVIGPTEVDRIATLVSRRVTGVPMECGPGSAFALPTPRFTATAELTSGALPHKWGYDDGGTEHGSGLPTAKYGAAGTFSYIACLGWGRRPWLHPTKGWGFYAPFYLSPPCLPSSSVTTSWGGGAAKLTLVDADYIFGFGQDTSLRSYQGSGLEWWIFRARTATQDPADAANHAAHKYIEADGVYYLWNVTPVSNYVVYDTGALDPVDRDFPVQDTHMQGSLVFDVLPSDVRDVRVRGYRRMVPLEHDADVPPVPQEFIDAFMPLLASYMVGRREGEPDRESAYWKMYCREISKYGAEEGLTGAEDTTMGYALPQTSRGSIPGIFFNPVIRSS